jgi:hypothetical protein
MLLSCFVHERKHRAIKRYCNDVTNATAFEATSLKEVLCHHIAQLSRSETFDFSVGLVRPRNAPRKLAVVIEKALELPAGERIQTAAEGRFSALATCKVNDVVLLTVDGGMKAGRIWRHVECNGVAMSVISVWDFIRKVGNEAAEWAQTDNPQIVDMTDILDTVMWIESGVNVVRTLLPHHLR